MRIHFLKRISHEEEQLAEGRDDEQNKQQIVKEHVYPCLTPFVSEATFFPNKPGPQAKHPMTGFL